VGTPSIANLVFSVPGPAALGICCPVCKRLILLDESGANRLPSNRVLENIVDKYGENKKYEVQCQLCEEKDPPPATKMCEQCEVFYCDACLESCHPSRGPLAKHNLTAPSDGKALLKAKHKVIRCNEHAEESLSMFCMMCRSTVCYACVQDGRHMNHDVQAIGASCKAQKVSEPSALVAITAPHVLYTFVLSSSIMSCWFRMTVM
jgi:tripartite motif-containing protein 9/67